MRFTHASCLFPYASFSCPFVSFREKMKRNLPAAILVSIENVGGLRRVGEQGGKSHGCQHDHSTALQTETRAGTLIFFSVLLSADIRLDFGGGFYVGMRATRRVARSGPDFLKPILGVQGNWLGTPPPVVPAAAPAPVAAAPAAPATPPAVPAAPTNGAVAAPPSNAPNPLPASRVATPAGVAAPGTSEALDQNVAEYNAVLHHMENSFHDYMIATQVLSGANVSAEDRDAANDHAHTAADDLQSYTHRAQTLYDAIHADSLFLKKYKETDRALDPTTVRAQFSELTVDNLRYIRPK